METEYLTVMNLVILYVCGPPGQPLRTSLQGIQVCMWTPRSTPTNEPKDIKLCNIIRHKHVVTKQKKKRPSCSKRR